MRILLVDNHDSFTYNLAQMLRELAPAGSELYVVRNDELDTSFVDLADRLILSPGPGLPDETTNLLPVIRTCATRMPILGICLGHQAIAQVHGAGLINARRVFHGVSSEISLDTRNPLFDGLPASIRAGRYHSWYVDEKTLPACLEVTARDEEGMIMALSHRELPIHGVQFHPESILTPEGGVIVKNFLDN